MTDSPARVYLLRGDDALSRDDVVRRFKARLLERPAGELNLSELHAPDVTARELIAICDTLPFIDDRRLVIVHNLFGWRPKGANRRRPAPDGDARSETTNPLKPEREAFLAYLPNLAPRTTLLLVEGELTPTQQAEIVKQVPRDRLDVRAFPAPRGAALEGWLAKRARQHGGALGPRVANLLRVYGPTSLEGLDQELAKLVTYAGPDPVSVDDLDQLLPGGEIIVFELLDAIADGRPAQALTSLHRLFRQGQRPEELAPQIIGLYRRLLVCRLALEERSDPAEVQRTHGVKLVDRLRTQARQSSAQRLEQALDRLLTFDRKLKRGEIEPESGLELLVAELAEAADGSASVRR